VTDPFSNEQGDPFGDPQRNSNRPNMAELYGRLILLEPRKIETVKNNLSSDPGATVDRLTTDLDILDGEFPIVRLDGRTGQTFDKLRPPKPQPEPLTERHYDSMWINPTGIVNACRASVAGRGPRMILGRVRLGEAKAGMSAPYYLEPGSEKDKDAAREYLAARAVANPQSLVWQGRIVE
jgi:hypothetical protein